MDVDTRHFNYQSDKEHVATILEKGAAEPGVLKVEKLEDTLAKITFDPAKTNMGILIKAYRAYKVRKLGDDVSQD